MKTYIAVVHKGPESVYGVSFPDLPGCISAADTLGAVLPNACEALAQWFEHGDDVAPRGMAAIRAEVAADLLKDNFLLAVPHPASTH